MARSMSNRNGRDRNVAAGIVAGIVGWLVMRRLRSRLLEET